MPIKKANELDFSNKPITLLIQGVPSIGKTTLALSSEKPLLIDLEKGVGRVQAKHRTDTFVVEDWAELNNTLRSEDLSEYKTIILDTLGSAVDNYLLAYLKEQNPAYVQKDGKTLSLKGYGQVKVELKSLMNFVKSKNLNLIIITHVKSDKDGDNVIFKPDIAGALKDEIFNDVDLACFYETIGNKRRINFSPTDRFSAKGNHGVVGVFEISDLDNPNAKNEDLQRLFALYRGNLQEEVELNKKYEEVVASFNARIDNLDFAQGTALLKENEACEDHIFASKDVINQNIYNYFTKKYVDLIKSASKVDVINNLVSTIKTAPSEIKFDMREISKVLKEKATELGLTLNKETKLYEKI